MTLKKRSFAALLAVTVLVAGCASFSKDSLYLVKNVDDGNKAVALTNQGIAAYNAYLVEQKDFGKTEAVRQYFVVALRYDPGSPKARQYLEKVDNFKSALGRQKLAVAGKLLAKPKRSDDENFTLVSALQVAVAVDPSNESASKLLRENAGIQGSLVESYLTKGKQAQAKAADPATKAAAREGLYVQGYDSAVKASALDPPNAQAAKLKSETRAALDKAFDAHVAGAAKLVAASKFEDAKAEVGRAGFLNAKLGRARDDALAASAYGLYFKWAKALGAKGLLQEADDKLDLAIAARRSDEALALKAKFQAKSGSANQDASFDAALPEIDKYLDRGDLLGANKRVSAAARLTKDKAKLDQLDSRRDRITAALADLYEKGVASYRSENFKSAIDQLSVVVGIDAEYEQASDYLSKAREKLKLLEQFSD
jgi:hypothetical protein